MIRTERRLRLCTALVAVNLLFIWGNSLLPGEISSAISDEVKALVEALLPGDGVESVGGGLIRKLAHFTEFACLGALLAWRFGMLRRKRYLPLAWGIAAACVDETIQRFVPDRCPSMWDVGIDSCGVAAGILVLSLGHRYLANRRKQEDT